jgi:hypothetical protein
MGARSSPSGNRCLTPDSNHAGLTDLLRGPCRAKWYQKLVGTRSTFPASEHARVRFCS